MKEKTAFQIFLEEEVNKVKGIYYPVSAGFFRRAFIRKAACSRLHPNPGDEFCLPEVGPNYSIIAGYEKDYRIIRDDPSAVRFLNSGIREPLVIEKTSPDGYMILNGHHRWAAALRVGIKRLPVHIVDLTRETDIRKMLDASRSDRRVTLDLDEAVFRAADDPCLEKALPFPLNRIYRERLRLGIPALFHALRSLGYDIWVYTAGYYSLDYLKLYFLHYHVPVTGIVTGTARKAAAGAGTAKELEKLVAGKYASTIHIDNEMILRTTSGSQDFDEFRLSGSSETWSREVLDALEEMNKA